VDEELRAAGGLLEDLGLSVDDPAGVTESKSVRYVTATATRTGDQQTVVQHLTAGLASAGWKILSERPIDVTQSPANEGDEVIAKREGLVAKLAVFDRIGTREPPPGSRWVQLSVAKPDDALSWTRS